GAEVQLGKARLLVPDGLVADQSAVDAGPAPVHESHTGVLPRDDDGPVPVQVSEHLEIAVLDDEDADPLHLVVDGEAGEVRGRIEIAPEIDQLRIGGGSEIDGLARAAS